MKGSLGLIALVRWNRGPRAEAVGSFAGLGLGPTKALFRCCFFCASSAGVRDQLEGSACQAGAGCASWAVGVREGSQTTAGQQKNRLRRRNPARGWNCGDAFRPT